MFDIAITNCIILSSHNGYKPFIGSVGITKNIISAVTEEVIPENKALEFFDAKGKILMPGLVNAHCHGDMAAAKGIGDARTLKEQMEYFGEMGWFLPVLTDEDRFNSRKFTYCEALLNGTTSFVENMFWGLGDLSQKAFVDIGIRGFPAEDIRYSFMESDKFLTNEMFDEFNKTCIEYNCTPVLGTLPEEEFTEYRLNESQKIIKSSNSLYTSHLCETKWRFEAAKAKFDLSPVKVLEKFNLLSDKYFGSHGIYFEDGDLDILAKNNVKIINTPLCEAKIADGIAPIREMLDKGIVVGLGTDGAMWNNSNDLFREMKCMALIHNFEHGPRTFTTNEILDMATINGAKALGLEDKLGTIECGKYADLILINTENPNMFPTLCGEYENVRSNVVFCATGADVTDVMVNGEFKVKDSKLVCADIIPLKKSVIDIAYKVNDFVCNFHKGK